jgi:predicted SAM-dependent methyltransferase
MKFNQVDREKKYLNLGCGYRFNPQWTNVNFVATGQDVIAHNLSKGIPFADNTFELVYHSHVLEHFPKASATFFLQECCRVLCPGGILRVVVPDLEQIARLYLTSLEKASSSLEWSANYDWITLELLDQMVRNSRGGDMGVYLAQEKIPNQEFVIERFGLEVSKIRKSPSDNRRTESVSRQIRKFGDKIHELLPKSLEKFFTALSIGYYRQSGEVHQWMYDRYSLSTLLRNCGMEKVVQRSATDSYLEHWTSFNLDTESDGRIYKPDSLYMEAVKPVHQANCLSKTPSI